MNKMIMVDDATVQQALEALEDAWLDEAMGRSDVAQHNKAITALREALAAPQPAQPEQAPESLKLAVRQPKSD